MAKVSGPGRRSLLIGGAAAAGVAVAAARVVPAKTRGPLEGPWAIELFTSQGCSSCPPADAYLGVLAKRPDIVALSFHVDYWDYIGWKDAFATRATTDRQRTYARVLKQRYVYTPEMVVEGIGHDTGRERGRHRALAGRGAAPLDQARHAGIVAHRRTARSPSSWRPSRSKAGPPTSRSRSTTVAIRRRWRAARTRAACWTTSTSCAACEVLSRWDGAAASWTIADAGLQPGLGAAVLVQRADHGPVIGCNKLEPMVSG